MPAITLIMCARAFGRRSIAGDLGDFFSFKVIRKSVDLSAPPYGGIRFRVHALLGNKFFSAFNVDMTTDNIKVRPFDELTSRNLLAFAGLDYPVFPTINISQHFAEKIHAYTYNYEKRENTRVKDLVDLVLLINSNDLNKNKVMDALRKTFTQRNTHLLPEILPAPPEQWKEEFAALAAECGLEIMLESEVFNSWLEQQDALGFLADNADEDWIVVYCTLTHSFIHAVFVPNGNLNPLDIDDLLCWNGNAYGSGWGIAMSKTDAWIEPTLTGFASDSLKTGEQLVFVRDFAGVDEHPTYFELLQKLVHVCEMHFVGELGAWCKLAQGKKKPVARVAYDEGWCVVLLHRDIIATYASLSRMTLVRMFDFPRYNQQKFVGWHDIALKKMPAKNNIYYNQRLMPGYASCNTGIQLIDIAMPIKEIVNKFFNIAHNENRKHEKFIVLDWKNRKICEVSCAPDATVNYFTASKDLPFELSPVFFDQEVLLRYKSDSKKYKVTENEISCRGAWSLPYDINAAGQVYAYLLDLRQIPCKEQSYWKIFNENPLITNLNQQPLQLLKDTLSDSSFKAHFLGSWEFNPGSLQSLKDLLLKLQCPWWKMSSLDAIEQLNYPTADSEDDWQREIIALDQLLVEGLQHKWLSSRAKSLGCNVDSKWKSLKLLEQCLIYSGVDEDRAKQIILPLRKLHNLRSKSSHTKSKDMSKLSKQAISDHGSYYKHYNYLVDTSRRTFLELIDRIR